MSTKNPTREQRSLAEQQRELGGIAPSLLKAGDTARIVTNKAVYEITVVDKGRFKRYNVTCDHPSEVWESAHPEDGVARIMSHHSGLKFDMMDWIGKGMRPVFKFIGGASIMIASVKEAYVSGENYEYKLWDD
jgi:hypothetical protein